MKKKLLLVLLCLGTSYYVKSQTIDVIGKGIYDLTTENLPLANASNIDSVRAGAIYSWNNNATSTDAVFRDVNGLSPSGTIFSTDIINKSVFASVNGAYYTSLFENSDESGITIDVFNGQELFMHSFYAFVYSNIPLETYKSYSSLETVYFYKNGSASPYNYNIAIDPASGPRDITVKIPISELQNDNRVAIIDIIAGSKTHHAEVTTYNASPLSDLGNSLFIGKYILTDVPGDVENISVNIYSPTSSEAQDLGYINPDSFYVNGVVVDVDYVFDGCTLTQGYWKNHSDCPRNGKGPKRDNTWDSIGPDENNQTGENSSFFISEQSYCEVFATNPGHGGKYYILAHQYIAAELNLLNNSNPVDVAQAFNESTKFLETYSPSDVEKSKELQSKCVLLGGVLDKFNNGIIGPGHCDETSLILSVEEEAKLSQKIEIYPNPVTSEGTIIFKPQQSGESTVELYNLLGQKVSELYHGPATKGSPISVKYNSKNFKGGIHFVRIKNGSSFYSKKLSISN